MAKKNWMISDDTNSSISRTRWHRLLAQQMDEKVVHKQIYCSKPKKNT